MDASQVFILTAVLYLQILMCINSEFYKINIIRYNKTILTNSKLYVGQLNCEKLGFGHYYVYNHLFSPALLHQQRREIHHIKPSRKLTRYQCYFLTLSLLLMQAGDINLNPGLPTTVKRTPRYPCTVCDRGVRSNSKAVSCDNCELWTHINCCHMDGYDYNA